MATKGVLRNYLRPRFDAKPLVKITRDDLKQMIAEMIESKLSRGTILRALFHGRERVKQDFEAEFRPIFTTFTTGRSA